MIKLKFSNKSELKVMIRFFNENIPYLKGSGNELYLNLIQSIISDIEKKIINKIINSSIKCTLSLKLHEAIALVTLWMDTTRGKPDYTDSDYNLIHIKISYLQQKIS